MSRQFVVREARREDAANVARVHVAAWKAAYRDFMPAKQMAWISEERETRRNGVLIEDPATPVIVATSEDQIFGFLAWGTPGYKDEPAHVQQLYSLFVDPDFFRQGIATLLLESMENQTQATELIVWVMSDATLGHSFYLATGFELEPQSKCEFRLIDRDFEIVKYRKKR